LGCPHKRREAPWRVRVFSEGTADENVTQDGGQGAAGGVDCMVMMLQLHGRDVAIAWS